ncbi:MAG: hypothetical protein ACYDDA_09285 [Acidiferrobacteraceae bacterium]
MASTEKPSIERFGKDLSELFRSNRMVVFLCGPSLKETNPTPGAVLRKKLQEILEKDGFEVVLGEDDGLEWLRKRYLRMAHLNELAFVEEECGAIVLIADSVGSYCELGLFSYIQPHHSHKIDFILIIDAQHELKPSYLNAGPAQAVKSYGLVVYAKLDEYEGEDILMRLQDRRAIYLHEGRGKSKM